MTVTNSTLLNNSAIEKGGAIFTQAMMEVTNSILLNNTAGNNDNDGEGGAIYASASSGQAVNVTVKNSTLSSNSAISGSGGAIFATSSDGNANANLKVTNSTLSGNSAKGFYGKGGAIFANAYSGNPNNNVSVTVENSTLSGNSAKNHSNDEGDGGAIFANAYAQDGTTTNATVTVKNSTLSDNSAEEAIYVKAHTDYTNNSKSKATLTLNSSLLLNNKPQGKILKPLQKSQRKIEPPAFSCLVNSSDNGEATIITQGSKNNLLDAACKNNKKPVFPANLPQNMVWTDILAVKKGTKKPLLADNGCVTKVGARALLVCKPSL